jgi:hypothetical protein
MNISFVLGFRTCGFARAPHLADLGAGSALGDPRAGTPTNQCSDRRGLFKFRFRYREIDIFFFSRLGRARLRAQAMVEWPPHQ